MPELGLRINLRERLTCLFLILRDPIRPDFKSEDTEVQDLGIARGKKVIDEDLGKHFKKAQRTTLTCRIIEFAGLEYKMPANIKLYDGTTDPEDHLSRFANMANSGEWPIPVWFRMFQQFLDGSARGWFERLSHDIINEWVDLREAFAARWTVETSFIMGVPEVMKISSFMDSVKTPELAKHLSNEVPTTVNEMMERLDDFVRSEEAYARTELLKGEVGETHRKASLPLNRRDNWGRGPHGREAPQPTKVVNVNSMKDKKRKGREIIEPWLNILISFLKISSEDVSEEHLIVEAEVEGYLVRRVYVDEGSSVEDKLFKKQYPYVEKISCGFRHAVSNLLKVYPDSPPSGQDPPNKPSSKVPSTSAPDKL
uniref:Reverse transcriptase domain-containing protein n=1 Tax=Tanacetum cinerariifolium TaxID=118510 RepID=A0A6L2LB49_TANCI|nr:hypothetical protein [Tanacetum cinerariifolium]